MNKFRNWLIEMHEPIFYKQDEREIAITQKITTQSGYIAMAILALFFILFGIKAIIFKADIQTYQSMALLFLQFIVFLIIFRVFRFFYLRKRTDLLVIIMAIAVLVAATLYTLTLFK